MAADQEKADLGELIMGWWLGRILSGLLLIALGIYENLQFDRLERGEVDSIMVPRLYDAIYEVAGRWPLLLLFFGVGAFLVFWGAKKRWDDRTDD